MCLHRKIVFTYTKWLFFSQIENGSAGSLVTGDKWCDCEEVVWLLSSGSPPNAGRHIADGTWKWPNLHALATSAHYQNSSAILSNGSTKAFYLIHFSYIFTMQLVIKSGWYNAKVWENKFNMQGHWSHTQNTNQQLQCKTCIIYAITLIWSKCWWYIYCHMENSHTAYQLINFANATSVIQYVNSKQNRVQCFLDVIT